MADLAELREAAAAIARAMDADAAIVEMVEAAASGADLAQAIAAVQAWAALDLEAHAIAEERGGHKAEAARVRLQARMARADWDKVQR